MCSLCAVAGLLLGPGILWAAASEDPDWPCIQRKVPEISAGMVWEGPAVEGLEPEWRAEAEVAALAQRIAARSTSVEDGKKAIQALAARQASGKDHKLTLLFAATLAAVNTERNSIIEGIKRYARRQAKLAEKIQLQIEELNGLPHDGSDDQKARRRELQERNLWDTRIYEERERSLSYICEQPVILEQRIFALAREIMMHLD
ncbi:MAG: hypothetical protein OEM93_23045 [Rhodospirillales bacterium]|nr:hypothetical protein [Rhodospirillales bacterium]